MQKRGITASGTQRWFCISCKTSAVKTRPDRVYAARTKTFIHWITSPYDLSIFALKKSISKRTLIRQLATCWLHKPLPSAVALDQGILIIDAIYLEGRTQAVLIGRTLTGVVYWSFAYYENYESWKEFLHNVPLPEVVVCDGRKGLLQAVRETFPHVRIQRCIAHVIRYGLSLLTTRPKTEAGKKLRIIVCQLGTIRTRRQKRKWLHNFFHWKKKCASFLNQRTYETHFKKKRWWYTHRKLRSASQLIFHALPQLFTCIGHYHIPRTSNHVEGGINARLKELLHRHRGLSVEKRKTLTAYFLSSKQRQKPPRNVT